MGQKPAIRFKVVSGSAWPASQYRCHLYPSQIPTRTSTHCLLSSGFAALRQAAPSPYTYATENAFQLHAAPGSCIYVFGGFHLHLETSGVLFAS